MGGLSCRLGFVMFVAVVVSSRMHLHQRSCCCCRWGPLGWAGAGLIITSSLGAQLGGSGTEKAHKKPKDA